MNSQGRRSGKEPWIALVGPEVEENLSLRHLASSLSAAGFRSEIVPFNAWSEFPKVEEAIALDGRAPAVVALSLSFQWRAKDFLSLAVRLRERGYCGHITAGGHFGTFAAEDLLRDFPELDSICLHESEQTIVSLARAVSEGQPVTSLTGVASRDCEGAVVRNPLPSSPDLARLPWPDRGGEPATCLGHRIAPMVSSRGCYARCHFCCIAEWHEQTLPGLRYRSRPLRDVAEEMAWLMRERRIEIFIFHDDNFFVPGRESSLERVRALADELERLRVPRFATVVKARPTDVDEELFTAMKERLGLIRLYLGVESDSEQGLRTLGRRVSRDQNRRAMEILDALGVYVCFNMLIFDPDTTPASLGENLAFIERHAECPLNFGRVELYAGTPLLKRMLSEGRCTGDYLGWDYSMRDAVVQRAFETAMRCFYGRNFAPGSLANRLMGTRFDAEVARFFHPDRCRPEWLERSKALSRALALDSVRGLREILAFSKEPRSAARRSEFERGLGGGLRETEARLEREAAALEQEIREALGARHVISGPVPETRAADSAHAEGRTRWPEKRREATRNRRRRARASCGT